MDSGPQGLGRPRQEPASSTAGVTRTERAPCASAAWLCCPGHLLVTLHPPGMLVLNLTLSRGFPAPSWAASCPKIARKSQRQSGYHSAQNRKVKRPRTRFQLRPPPSPSAGTHAGALRWEGHGRQPAPPCHPSSAQPNLRRRGLCPKPSLFHILTLLFYVLDLPEEPQSHRTAPHFELT